MHFRRAGQGPSVVLIHALACDLTLWDPQAEALAAHHDVVRYDVRGHGLSPLPAGGLSFDALADDLAKLLDSLGIARAHVVGLSMGGVIARLFALRHPQRVARLALCATLAALPPEAASAWRERAQLVRERGMAAIVEWTLAQWFPAEALRARTPAVEHARAMIAAAPADGYLAVCAAVPELDFFARQGEIRAPTLVLAGAADPKLRSLAPEALARAIPGALLHLFSGAGHLPNLDAPDKFNRVLLEVLRS